MKLPENRFKAKLKSRTQQIGLWSALGGPSSAELLGGGNFDWVVLDTEHSPAGVTNVLPMLQAMAAFPDTSAVVRPAWNDTVLIKRFLDLGAQTLLIPYVQNAKEAAAAVAAMRYPPAGVRGVAGGTRASGYGRIASYMTRAEDELCLIVQIETADAMGRLEEIASVEGVDAVFIGPADLAASMGLPGQMGHPDVKAMIEHAIERLNKLGVPAGILTLDNDFAKRCIECGTLFTAVGTDVALLVKAADALAAKFKD